MNDIIETMINQFCVNLSRLKAMTGASNFVYDNNSNSLLVNFKSCRKANTCQLQYNYSTDLYTMHFKKYNNRTCEIKDAKIFTDLYADQLQPIFEDFTGLYISL